MIYTFNGDCPGVTGPAGTWPGAPLRDESEPLSSGLALRVSRELPSAPRAMKSRRLGKTGLTVSEICLGTMTFGSIADETTSRAILDKAFEGGVDFFDTA